jgi:exopolysaccharide acyltransferase PssR
MAANIRNGFRLLVLWLRRLYLVRVYRMDIANSARVSWGARLDKTYPRGIHIGDESYFASGCWVLTHDFSRGIRTDTYIGKRCFVGVDAIILPGIKIGDSVVVGAGAVVTRDIPSGCVVAGNPATILRQGVCTGCFGRIEGRAESHVARLRSENTGRGRIRETVSDRGQGRGREAYVHLSSDNGRTGQRIIDSEAR